MRINYNVSAMIANNALSRNDDALSASLERLSSGLKINHAKDNPAGLAMGKRMNAQIEGLSIANQNASNGISVMETADGALGEMQSILQRMNELAVKASTGTLSADDRSIINDEIVQLKEELTRIKNTTEFNSMPLLNGEFSYKGYTSDEKIKVEEYSDGMPINEEYLIDQLVIDDYDPATGEFNDITFTSSDPKLAGATVKEIKENTVTIETQEGYEIKLDVSRYKNDTAPITVTDLELDLTGIGAMRLQIGANEGQVLEIPIPDVSLKHMGIENLDVLTPENAEAAIDSVDTALAYLSSVRSKLGAYQNRLENNVTNLNVTSENMTSAYSRIMDVDMAEEMTSYTTNQILTQAATSMLAQANERPQQILQLLK